MAQDWNKPLRDPAITALSRRREGRLTRSRRNRGPGQTEGRSGENYSKSDSADTNRTALPEIDGIETLPNNVVAELAGQVVIAEVTNGRMQTPYIPTVAFKQGVQAAMSWLLSDQEPVASAEEFSGSAHDLELARTAVLAEFASRLIENRGPSHG